MRGCRLHCKIKGSFAACLIVLLTSALKLHAVGGLAECTRPLQLLIGTEEPSDTDLYNLYFEILAQLDMPALKSLESQIQSNGTFEPHLVDSIPNALVAETLADALRELAQVRTEAEQIVIIKKALEARLKNSEDRKKKIKGARKFRKRIRFKKTSMHQVGEASGIFLQGKENEIIGVAPVHSHPGSGTFEVKTMKIWDRSSGNVTHEFDLKLNWVTEMLLSPNKDFVALLDNRQHPSENSIVNQVELWDLKNKKRVGIKST